MRICEQYNIPCPYRLVAWEELPCYADQQQCDEWRKKWAEAPEEDKAKVKVTHD